MITPNTMSNPNPICRNRGMSYFRNPSSKNRQILFLENPNILLTLLIYRITALVNNRSGSPLRTMESTDPEKIV